MGRRSAVKMAIASGAAVFLLLLLPAVSQAQTRVNIFAGAWSTFGGTGTLQLQVTDAAHGQPAVVFYSDGMAMCPAGTTYYTGAYTVQSDSGQVAGCTDPAGKNLEAWYKSGAGPQYGSFSVTGYVDPNSFAGTYHEFSDGSSGAYSGVFTGDFPTDGCCIDNAPPTVRLTAATDLAELLQTDSFHATLAPAGTTATEFKFEIKRALSNDWLVLSDGSSNTLQFDASVAGHFDVRVVANVDGMQIISQPQPLEIEFPTEREIASNLTVEYFVNGAWHATLRLANRRTRREEGFWITLDACTDSYAHTPTALGPAIGPRMTGSVNIGDHPADSPAAPPPNGCATYTVASFHTHTPTRYRPEGRPIGPSETDQRLDREDGTPGLVYDYISSPPGNDDIPAHYPLNSPAKVYASGPARRSTPP